MAKIELKLKEIIPPSSGSNTYTAKCVPVPSGNYKVDEFCNVRIYTPWLGTSHKYHLILSPELMQQYTFPNPSLEDEIIFLSKEGYPEQGVNWTVPLCGSDNPCVTDGTLKFTKAQSFTGNYYAFKLLDSGTGGIIVVDPKIINPHLALFNSGIVAVGVLIAAVAGFIWLRRVQRTRSQ